MWRGDPSPQAFQAPVDVHASADGQVYMFKRRPNENVASSDEEELSILEMRKMKRDRQNVQLLEREVLDGDNLNKIALQYGCKVADLKRVNNLIHDQDLFALKFIKIPVQRHGVLTETFPDHHDVQEETPHSASSPGKFQDRARNQSDLREVTDFLMEVDNDIDKFIQSTTDQDDLLGNSEESQRHSFKRPHLSSHGADWGIQWWNAVIAMLLIGIALPIFYIIYFKMRDDGVDSHPDAAVLSSTSSSNISGTDLGTPKQFQEPG